MKLSTVNSTRIGSRDKSLTNEIASVQGLQSLLTNNVIASRFSCDFNKVSGVPLRSPQVQHKRSQPPQASQLNLLALLEQSFKPKLKVKLVPINLTLDKLDNHPSEALSSLISAFQRLADITDLVEFHVQFEKEQRASALRLGTFKSAWKTWRTQQQDRGGDV